MNNQTNLSEQLKELRQLANNAGLYDACDWLDRQVALQNYLKVKTVLGHYYTKFENETLEEAVNCHSVGYKSIQDAHADSQAMAGDKGMNYEVYDHNLVLVDKGVVE